MIGGGFSVRNGECVYNSRSWNMGSKNNELDNIHFGAYVMNPLEQKYISVAMYNWMHYRQQNTSVASVPKEYENTLCVHPNALKQ